MLLPVLMIIYVHVLVFISDFPAYTSPKETETFPFIDYDEYDAQIFKLPVRNKGVPM